MTLVELLNWLLLPALGGLAWIARSVSRLETEVATLKANNTELWKQVNDHTKGISDVKQSVARIEGHLEK
mgnify:CR=1 FL=1